MIRTRAAKILVIDDEADLCELVGDALRVDGLQVASAGSGAEGCAQAQRDRPDLVVADLALPDCSGLELIGQLRDHIGEVPTVVITGTGDIHSASEAWRHGCVDFLTKPLNLHRLRNTIRRELSRRGDVTRLTARTRRLRLLARELNRRRHSVKDRLDTTCAALTSAYRTLNHQFTRQETLIRFQRQLLTFRTDDDIFRGLFSLFCENGGNLFGVALVCDENADLKMVGRFGTPAPDSVSICQGIAFSLLDVVLENPSVMPIAPAESPSLFPKWLHQHLAGVTFLCVPLLPDEGQLIGLSILYRKSGQPFTDDDRALAEMLAPSVAMAVQGNGCAADE